MGIKRKSVLLACLICLVNSIAFGEQRLKTGYDLYHNIKLMDNEQTLVAESETVFHTMGYLVGYLDGIRLMQTALYEQMFPAKLLSEEEREKLAKKLNFRRLNIPASGLATGQMVLIYKKWAEKHPELLNETVRICIFLSLVDAYGWK